MAPSDEGAVSVADWGRENVTILYLSQRFPPRYVFSPSVACGDSSLIISARRRYASEQPAKPALSESQREPSHGPL